MIVSADGKNNPRGFRETVSLTAWRSNYDADKSEANLHIDVVFGTGRIGGKHENSDVRFELSLKKATLHIKKDNGGVVKIPPGSVVEPSGSFATEVESSKIEKNLEIGGELGSGSLKDALFAKGKLAFQNFVSLEKTTSISSMKFRPRAVEDGYEIEIMSHGKLHKLQGVPWDKNEPRMSLRDTNPARKRGDPPEVVVSVFCRREDLIIDKIKFVDRQDVSFGALTEKKKVAVIQYIREAVLNHGFECSDLSDPYAMITLGDVVTEEF